MFAAKVFARLYRSPNSFGPCTKAGETAGGSYPRRAPQPGFVATLLATVFCLGLLGFPEAAHAQTPAGFSNFDDINPKSWLLCSGSCAGGNSPTKIVQNIGIMKPSLDGKSMQLSISGNGGTNNGWYLYSGAQDSLTTFKLDMYFNVPSKAFVQALEFDQFQYLHAGSDGVPTDTRLYFGTQCVIGNANGVGNTWWVWDSSGIGWVDTTKACNFKVSTTAFNHLVISAHRVTGDTSCFGRPCMHYDSISLNGTVVVSNKTTNSGALPTGWAEQTGFMIQLDTTGACSNCTITEYDDKGNFTIN